MSATWDTVRKLAGELPEVEEGTSYRTPALKVRGRMFVRLREDEETIVVWTDYDEREALTQGQPETFLVTPHYEDYPLVLIRLARVDADELRELLTESWRDRAPKRLRAAYDAGESSVVLNEGARQASTSSSHRLRG